MKIIVFLFLLISAFSFGQKKKGQFLIDSLLIEINNSPKKNIDKCDLFVNLSKAYYVSSNPTKVLEYSKKGFELSSSINYKKGIAESKRFEAIAYLTMGSLNDAESTFNTSLKHYEDLKDPLGMLACLSNLGTVNTIQNNYASALKYYQKAIKVCLESKNDKYIGIIYNNVGVIYSELKNYELALQYFQKSLESQIKINNKEGIASGFANIANVNFEKNEYEKALNFYEKSLNKYLEIDHKSGAAQQYGNIASVYVKQKKYLQANANLTKALSINQEIKNKKGIAVNLQGLGNYYYEIENYDQAIKNARKSNILATEIGIKEVQKQTYDDLSKIFGKLGKTDSSYFFYKKFIEIKDIIENENTKKQIARLEVQYEFDTKEEKYKTNELLAAEKLNQQLLILDLNKLKLVKTDKEKKIVELNFIKTQNDLKNEQLERKSSLRLLEINKNQLLIKNKENQINKFSLQYKEKQKWYLISALALLGIIGGLLFYQSRNRQKVNQKLQLLNTELDQKNIALDAANKNKTRFFSIINHDLRSPVSNLIDFLHIQKDSPELLDAETKIRIQETTLTSAENLLSSMEDILLWSKGQMENFKPVFKRITVSSLFEDIRKHFSSEDKVKISFENPNNIEIETDEDYLKTIVRNLTGNALKALNKTENPTIIWKVYREKKQVFLSISDNGSGGTQEDFKALYDEKEIMGIKTGLGLHLIRDLSKAINCEIDVETIISKGTTFVLSFNVD